MDIRRRLMIGLGLATAVAASSKNASAANSQLPGHPQPEPQDAWLDEGGKRHRIVFDTLSANGLGAGMNFAKNFIEGNREAYGIAATELSVVMILRHWATAMAFNDQIWEKYGDYLVDRTKTFDPRTKATPRVNLYNTDLSSYELPNGKVTLPDLSKQGVRFAVCAMAARNMSIGIAKNLKVDADSVLHELEANLAASAAIMVPAGILTVNRAQEHGYTFSYCG